MRTIRRVPARASRSAIRAVDANIQIRPNGTNQVGTGHVFTAHVNVNSGSGFVSAPAGTSIRFTINSGPGSFTTANPCTTVGTTGSCTVRLTSPTPGTTVVGARVTVSVGGVSLTRRTNDTGANSGPATKLWWELDEHSNVHNAKHQVVTAVPNPSGVIPEVLPGTVVHDKAFVKKAAGTPASVANPTGSVVFHRFAKRNCTGPSVDEKVRLGDDGTAESSSFTVVTEICYRADYLGDSFYPSVKGGLEPVQVVLAAKVAIEIVKCPAKVAQCTRRQILRTRRISSTRRRERGRPASRSPSRTRALWRCVT